MWIFPRTQACCESDSKQAAVTTTNLSLDVDMMEVETLSGAFRMAAACFFIVDEVVE